MNINTKCNHFPPGHDQDPSGTYPRVQSFFLQEDLPVTRALKIMQSFYINIKPKS